VLRLRGTDMLDESPLIDIKPFIPSLTIVLLPNLAGLFQHRSRAKMTTWLMNALNENNMY
jgi:tRNA (Thr-GGU) A37 N-methylase